MKKTRFRLCVLGALSCFGCGIANAAPVEYKIPASEAEFQSQWTTVEGTDGMTWEWVEGSEGSTPYAQISPWASSDANSKNGTGTTLVYATPISMKAGDVYILQAMVCSADYNDDERFYLVAGTDKHDLQPLKATTSANYVYRARNNAEPNFQLKPTDSNAASQTLTISEDGDYYIGIRSWYGSVNYSGGPKLQVSSIIATKDVNYPANATSTKAVAAADGSLSVTLTWTWPTKCKDNSTPLTGELHANIYRGRVDNKAELYQPENKIATVSKADGEATGTYVDNTITEPGKYFYYIAPENEAGENPDYKNVATCKWVGEDIKLLNILERTVTVTKSDDAASVILSWTERIEGYNGGYVNPEKVSYYIERSKNGADFTVIAEKYVGKPPYIDSNLDGFGSYQYRIYAVYDNDLENKSTAAKSTVIVAGGSLEPPYSEDFSDSSNFNLFTSEYSSSSYKWNYSSGKVSFNGGSTYYSYTASLITPPLKLVGGKTYRVAAKTWVSSSSAEKEIVITAGNNTSALTEISDNYTVDRTSAMDIEAYFVPESDGIYYFGFKSKSSDYSYIYLDDISVEESVVAPAAIADLAFVPDPKGANEATVSFTMPSEANGGVALESISSVVVSRTFAGETTVVKNFEGTDAVPGKAVSFIDKVPEAGKYSYSAVSILDGNASDEAATDAAWIGYDIPREVSGFGMSTNIDENGGAIVKWSANTYATGKNGGFVDNANLSYEIVRINSDKEEEFVGATRETTFSDPTFADVEWGKYTYGVVTVNGYQKSNTQTYSSVTGGKANLPYYPELTDDYVNSFPGRAFTGDNGITFKNRGEQGSYEYIAYLPPFDVTNTSDDFWHALSLTLSRAGAEYHEVLEVQLCTVKLAEASAEANDRADMAAAVIPGENSRKVIKTIPVDELANDPASKTVGFQIKEKGRYRIALRCASEYNKGLTIHSLSIVDSTTTGIEDAVTDNGLSFDGNSLRLPDNAATTSVFAIDGKKVAETTGNIAPDLSSLASGIYVVRIATTDKETLTLKINIK